MHLLRASLPVGGRSLTLYEEVHPQQKLNNAAVHRRFLQRLATLLPAGVAPIVIADAGFKVPFHREVESLGWRWVGRVRGRVKSRWTSCKRIFMRATAAPTALGEGDWVRSNPLRAVFVLVRKWLVRLCAQRMQIEQRPSRHQTNGLRAIMTPCSSTAPAGDEFVGIPQGQRAFP
ncbi:MAG: hypothetical protein EA400_14295 [Chromatiaceae bacterium]|nr:MAG: hypothetical protein EA400_14295 [Chromatiaceae bacterium]